LIKTEKRSAMIERLPHMLEFGAEVDKKHENENGG